MVVAMAAAMPLPPSFQSCYVPFFAFQELENIHFCQTPQTPTQKLKSLSSTIMLRLR